MIDVPYILGLKIGCVINAVLVMSHSNEFSGVKIVPGITRGILGQKRRARGRDTPQNNRKRR